MSVERIHNSLVKTRYFLQACLFANCLYGVINQAYAAYVAPEPALATQEQFTTDQLRTAVTHGDTKALEAQFVGKKAEALKAFGITGVPDDRGTLHYTTGFSVDYFYPGDGPNWPRHSVKGVEFRVNDGLILGISLYGFQ